MTEERNAWTASLAERRVLQAAYDAAHAACPVCHGTDNCQTLAYYGPEVQDRNSVKCRCGWTGIVHDLVPKVKS